jgi:peroxiredoxin
MIFVEASFGIPIQKEKSELAIKAIIEQCRKPHGEGKYEEVLNVLTEAIKKYPKSLDLIQYKLEILNLLERPKEAIETAIELDYLDGMKSANKALDIAKYYLSINEIENTLKWISTSVDRGFQNYFVFDKYDIYKALRGDKRLNALIDRMKENVGLGKPIQLFTRKDLAGETISPEKYLGNVLLIDFWATWCAPCLAEIPNLKKHYTEFHGKGFEIIGISLDQDKEKLDRYLLENKIEWPIVFGGKGWQDETKEMFGVKNVPASWLIDKKGIVRYFCLKGVDLRNAIIELMNE